MLRSFTEEFGIYYVCDMCATRHAVVSADGFGLLPASRWLVFSDARRPLDFRNSYFSAFKQ